MTTAETMLNARTVRDWMLKSIKGASSVDIIRQQFIACRWGVILGRSTIFFPLVYILWDDRRDMKSDYKDQISTNLIYCKYVCILCFFEYSLRSKKFNKFDRIPHHWDMIIIRKNKRHLAVSSMNRYPFATIFPPFSRSHVIVVDIFPDSLYLTIRLLLSIYFSPSSNLLSNYPPHSQFCDS